MSSSRIAKRYSKALINLCAGNGSTETVAKNLETFAAALKASPEAAQALNNPSIDAETHSKALAALVSSLGVSGHAANLIQLLGERRRLNEIPAILADFRVRLDDRAGRVRAVVTSAVALSADETQRIKAALEKNTGKSVILETSVDPSLLGGVVAQVGNLVLDGSVRTALTSVREQLLNVVQ
jgi:F-type H+-transporting ATPase subunit delta